MSDWKCDTCFAVNSHETKECPWCLLDDANKKIEEITARKNFWMKTANNQKFENCRVITKFSKLKLELLSEFGDNDYLAQKIRNLDLHY